MGREFCNKIRICKLFTTYFQVRVQFFKNIVMSQWLCWVLAFLCNFLFSELCSLISNVHVFQSSVTLRIVKQLWLSNLCYLMTLGKFSGSSSPFVGMLELAMLKLVRQQVPSRKIRYFMTRCSDKLGSLNDRGPHRGTDFYSLLFCVLEPSSAVLLREHTDRHEEKTWGEGGILFAELYGCTKSPHTGYSDYLHQYG